MKKLMPLALFLAVVAAWSFGDAQYPPQGIGSGTLSLIERVRVSTDATSTAFAATLDGDTDGTYFINGFITNQTASTATYTFEPNSLATNQKSVQHSSTNGAASSITTATALTVTVLTTTDMGYFSAKFYARSTDGTTVRPRFYTCDSAVHDTSDATLQYFLTYRGAWNETSTNVTSIRIFSNIASSIGVGSEFSLYKLGGS